MADTKYLSKAPCVHTLDLPCKLCSKLEHWGSGWIMEYRLHEWVTLPMDLKSEGIIGRVMDMADMLVREPTGSELVMGVGGGHTFEGCILSPPLPVTLFSFLATRK